MVAVYSASCMPRDAQLLFDEMPERNIISWNGLLSGYMKNGEIDEAREVFDLMLERNVVSWTTLVKGYVQRMMGESMMRVSYIARTSMIHGLCKEGRVDEAREIFDEMSERSVITWTTMVTGYGRNNRVDDARKLFDVMPEKTEVSWTSMLMSYTDFSNIDQRSFGLRQLSKPPPWFPSKDIIMWNSIISGYASHSLGEEALKIFYEMPLSGSTEPNEVTFVATLSACSYAGMVEEGLKIFESMESVLGTHSQLDLAEFCAKKLIEIETENSGSPTFMHLKFKVHAFTHGGICSHPEQESILKLLDELDGLLREAGYNPDCSYALHDVDEEGKVNSLKYPSHEEP
ncbi:unnamed protein product [Arabidopsis lyrata]|nr:unnamed protein product [Arabidopsis lyrata]